MTRAEPVPATTVEMVDLSIDGTDVSVPKGTLVIRAAELIGIQIPRFCDHPLLDPVGACRQCLVEVDGQRKPMASCTITATPGMIVHTQHSSPTANTAQRGVMELLLINHPLDCPVCDKGGECPLQNQAMSTGRTETRFDDTKRTFPKPINLSSQILLDRERCVLCARCTRFSTQIAGDPFIELLERGALQQIGIGPHTAFDSYFSGNTIQICPVGALTAQAYRFRARPFDLVSTPSVCEHCAAGCAQRTDHRRGTVLRRLAGDDPHVNEEWNCDKGRWAFTYPTQPDRITTPHLRDNGTLRPASWSEAITIAAAALTTATGSTGVLVGGRTTLEDAYAYTKFARLALTTNDIDFRARPHSTEEAGFLMAYIAGQPMTVTYEHLQNAPVVVLAGFEPEDESPIVFLRLRKAARTHGTRILAVAPFATNGLAKMAGHLIATPTGGEAAALDALVGEPLLRRPGAIIVVGERLATSPGALSAASRLAAATGARMAWIPRRAGERGALDAGCLPGLLPGGRPLGDHRARKEVCSVWNTVSLPAGAGRETGEILAAASSGALGALLVGGVEPADFPDPAAVRHALSSAPFVVSLEVRHSEVTRAADVVFPVAPVAEKAGTFVNWEGRARAFPVALRDSGSLCDLRVLDALALEMGIDIELPGTEAAARELEALGAWDGLRPCAPSAPAPVSPRPGAGEAVLASWRHLLDQGRLQDGAPHLAGTARAAVARLAAATAAEIGVATGDYVTVSTRAGSITLPLEITDMPDRVVWVPMNSPGSAVHQQLGVAPGAIVQIGVRS